MRGSLSLGNCVEIGDFRDRLLLGVPGAAGVRIATGGSAGFEEAGTWEKGALHVLARQTAMGLMKRLACPALLPCTLATLILPTFTGLPALSPCPPGPLFSPELVVGLLHLVHLVLCVLQRTLQLVQVLLIPVGTQGTSYGRTDVSTQGTHIQAGVVMERKGGHERAATGRRAALQQAGEQAAAWFRLVPGARCEPA